MPDSFFEADNRLLKRHAFEFVLDGELKRAVRSQNYLTLVTLETNREWDGMSVTADEGTVEGDLRGGVPHQHAHFFDVHARPYQQAGVGVAEIVEAQLGR